MTVLWRLVKALLNRVWRMARKMVTVVVRPPVRLVRGMSQRTVTGVPVAMQRHRERVSRDDSYARQIGTAITALVTTLVDSAPYASLAVVLLTNWLGTVSSDTEEPDYPRRASLSASVRDQQERSVTKDPVPLWDRLAFE